MARKVKNRVVPLRRSTGATRISPKHQVTIPAAVFEAAAFHAGDRLIVEADGRGRAVLTRTDEVVDRYAGCLESPNLRDSVDKLRSEWE